MKREISRFLELQNTSETLLQMGNECHDILFNLEILFENKLDVDAKYHDPKHFIIGINNFIRNIVFLVEKLKKSKSKYQWAYDSILRFVADRQEDMSILESLRNNSVHQELLVPDGAFSVGLYRIMSETEYKYKLGFGDKSDQKNLPPHYVYSKTESLFQKLLIYHYMVMIDIEHSALNECLGISRSWYINAQFKDRDGKKNSKVVDIYQLSVTTFDSLLEKLANDFASLRGIPETASRLFEYSEYNFVNTLLEIDLYPDLFSLLWNRPHESLNWGYFLATRTATRMREVSKKHIEVYKTLPSTQDELIARLAKLERFTLKSCRSQKAYENFIQFILLPHWYFKSVSPLRLLETKIVLKTLELYDLGVDYVGKHDRNFSKTSIEDKEKAIQKITSLISSIRAELVAV